MTYKIEEINGCTKKLIFSFEKVDLASEIESAVKEKRKSANLKGFRKGKAPLPVVQKIYGPQIESEALNKFVQKEFFDAVKKENLKVVGYPSFDKINYESKESISFEAIIEIFPDFELKDFGSLEFKKEKVDVSDDEVEEAKKGHLEKKVEMVAIEDEGVSLGKGHFAVMNFQGVKEDGERPENMKGQDHVLEIGSGQFVPGFEDGMMGMKSGEKKNIELTFPADYQSPDLQSAKVTFEVELLEIKEKKYPELTSELLKELGNFESEEDFTNKNKERIETQKERQAEEKLHQEILEKLVEDNQFDVPVAMITQQKEHIKKDLEKTLTTQGFSETMMQEYFEKWGNDLDKKAKFQVCSGLILDKLANKFNIESTDSDFDQKIEETAKTSGADLEQIKKWYSSNKEMRKNIMYVIREEKTFAKIVEQVKIS